MVTGILLMFGNLIYALRKGERGEKDPWGGRTLEWTVPSPPPKFQFDKVPEITHGPYDFGDDDEVKHA